ncbi:MAG: glycoside hydrolase family 2 [Clostridia bacterium]|nr:glycoside hydrolase family 2 [Clostridia bacterium]
MELDWLRNGYPRSQMYRDKPFFINSSWTLNGMPIDVPFPPESSASHWNGQPDGHYHYETAFTFSQIMDKPRVFLHFGAVDQTASVLLNGQLLGQHEGGYLPFCYEITGIVREGRNTLSVDVQDTFDHIYPYGKQSENPKGMWYTGVSGIWQPVWLETVPEQFLSDIQIRSSLSGIDIRLESETTGPADVVIKGDTCHLSTNCWHSIEIMDPEHWTPEHPKLYPVAVVFGQDHVRSYFALRTVEIREMPGGHSLICLNGQPVYLHGLLDQGYFPEGIYTAADPKQYETDILNAKALGFNTLRKHIKIEADVFYALCDLHGILVLQDMVNSGPYSYIRDTVLANLGLKYHHEKQSIEGKRESFFVEHCKGIQAHLGNHPCIIGYTIFNEGWGQFATSSVYLLLKANDPSRFYISASGWYKGYETDVDSEHVYFRNKVLHADKRPLLLSECGGFPCDLGGHDGLKAYGYGKDNGQTAWMDRISTLYKEMILPSIRNGLNGSIYTQLTDVEGEINGLYSYDRSICKADIQKMNTLASACREAFANFAFS